MIMEGVLVNYCHKDRTGTARTENGHLKVKFKGEYPYIQTGLKYKFTGEQIGEDLVVTDITPIEGELSLKDGLLLFPMLTESELKRVLDATNVSTYGELLSLDNIEKAIAELDKEKASEFMASIYLLKQNTELQKVMSLFKKTNIKLDITDAVNIINFFRTRAIRNNTTVSELIMACPWLLLQTDVFESIGEGVKAVDKIARYFSKAKGTANILACATSVVAKYTSNGHAYMPFYMVYKWVSEYYPCSQETFLSAITQKNQHIGYLIPELKKFTEEMAKEPEFADKNKYKAQSVYLARVFFEEEFIAEKLNVIFLSKPEPLPESIPQHVAEWASQRGITLNSAQKAVIDSVMNNKITVITGGAGSGKTTVLRALIYALTKEGIVAPLLAPTGIAAQRLAAESDVPFYTIHRYSHLYQDDDLFIMPENSNVEIQRDKIVIVDEMSMATVPVIARLLSIVGHNTRLVFSGDMSQLPPIGPGGVFDALIKANGFVNVINLPTSYRQKGSTIENALKIHNGQPINESNNVKIITAKTWDKAVEETLAQIQVKNIEDMYILAKSRKGVKMLNTAIREKLLETTETGFVEGDIVITTRNDYDSELKTANMFLKRLRQHRQDRPTIYNGTRGKVRKVTDELITVEFTLPNGKKLEAEYSHLEVGWYLEHAFAMTVHKAQGGQAKEVIFVEPQPDSLYRSMLYTAFTRSTGNITLIGGSRKDDWNNVKADEPQLSKLYWRILESCNKMQAGTQDTGDEDILIEI